MRINVTQAILIMGVVTILYTALGGMKAVIWTDVLQVIVLIAGALAEGRRMEGMGILRPATVSSWAIFPP